ncbi:glycosyltransferase family 4 protein [Pseudalkalibacillus sp. R45]|uniref:glycosyltransferase family 4 protein n=1 Tax=Pseudalkalibacillus sp. R45 TaxID=3457433 RepID=UPI003FCD3AFE
MNFHFILSFLIPCLTVLILTPYVKKFAIRIHAVDHPDQRKVHGKVMARLGGLAIFIGVVVGYFTSGLYTEEVTGITLAGIVIILTGLFDDLYTLSPKIKLGGQILAALLVISSGLTIDILNLPFIGMFEVGIWAYPLTLIWIIGITNSINLIDGLDGLAAGISSIVIGTIAVMAFLNGNVLILTIALVILGSVIGFLVYNFHPAKIFMGDTGSLFLGYMISVLSILGLYKSVTLFSFVVPIILLGVPIFDTIFAIIRRIANKKPITAPDKGHLHHRLITLGISHRNTVLIIYGFSIIFSTAAILFSSATLWVAIVITIVLLFATQVLAETIGLVNDRYKPFLNFYRKVTGKE